MSIESDAFKSKPIKKKIPVVRQRDSKPIPRKGVIGKTIDNAAMNAQDLGAQPLSEDSSEPLQASRPTRVMKSVLKKVE